MLASAARMGMALSDLACLDMQTFSDVCAEWSGAYEAEPEEVRDEAQLDAAYPGCVQVQ